MFTQPVTSKKPLFAVIQIFFVSKHQKMFNFISSVRNLILAALIFCYAIVSLSYAFTDDQDLVSFGHPLPRIEAIYQFGDSFADTGNLVRERQQCIVSKFPYGETIGKPTGRASDGLLIIDYFTKFFNLPFLDPYHKKHGNFTHGINFSVSGATALNVSTLSMKGVVKLPTNSTLLVQLDWFKSHLNAICSTPSDRKKYLAKSLIMMGEIGTNDYFFSFYAKKRTSTMYKLVSEVVQIIKFAIKEVIDLGAVYIVVPGNFQIGCLPIYLNKFKTNDSRMYDELQCLSYFNDFAKFHNNKVQEVIRELQKNYPHVSIVYADYFEALKELFRHATSLGFDKSTMGKTCCTMCMGDGNFICKNPDKYIYWDPAHLTQHSYQVIATWLIKNMFYDKSYVV